MIDEKKIEAGIRLLLEGIGAVSYTHLDVYKIQAVYNNVIFRKILRVKIFSLK